MAVRMKTTLAAALAFALSLTVPFAHAHTDEEGAAQTPASAAASASVPAPQPGPYARMVVIQPHAGQQAAFDAGYQRHLEWHRSAGDKWTWYGWRFVLGERLGKFMDGTFMHAAADFDAAINPAADGADNTANVVPYADFESHGIFERLPSLSAGAPLPDTSPFMEMTTYFVQPGEAERFEQTVRARVDAMRGKEARYSWYKLNVGGESPWYVLVRPVSSLGAAAVQKDWFGAPLRAGMVTRVRSELLRFDPKMSYIPQVR